MKFALLNARDICDMQRFGLFWSVCSDHMFCQESNDFREILRDCCPDLAGRSSMELLQRYRDEADRVGTMHHASLKSTKWPVRPWNLSCDECDFNLISMLIEA